MKYPLPLAAGVAVLALLAVSHPASAHSPICDCFKNDKDGTITCQGGFSDGSSAEGVAIRIVDLRERVIVAGKMDAKGLFTFKTPPQEFRVVFDAGQGHAVTIESEDIESEDDE